MKHTIARQRHIVEKCERRPRAGGRATTYFTTAVSSANINDAIRAVRPRPSDCSCRHLVIALVVPMLEVVRKERQLLTIFASLDARRLTSISDDMPHAKDIIAVCCRLRAFPLSTEKCPATCNMDVIVGFSAPGHSTPCVLVPTGANAYVGLDIGAKSVPAC